MSRQLFTLLIAGLLSLTWGCERVFGVFGPPHLDEGEQMRFLPVEVVVADTRVVFKTARPFRSIGCRQISEDYQTISHAWRAECPDGGDCTSEVTYGDPMLRSVVGPEALIPSQCYECGAGGSTGRGSVVFRFTAEGGVEPCSKSGPRRRP